MLCSLGSPRAANSRMLPNLMTLCMPDGLLWRADAWTGTLQRAQGGHRLSGNALARHHLLRVADGDEAACAARASCAAAAADGPTPLATRQVAAVGAAGSHDSNALRDVLRLHEGSVGENMKLQPWYVKIPCRVSRSLNSAVQEVTHPVYMPHEVFAALHECRPDAFEYLMLGQAGMQGLQEYWSKSAQHEWAQQHPGATHERCIPIILHGDDVQFTKTREAITVLAVHAELGVATTRLSRWLVAAVPTSWNTKETLMPIYNAVRYSFQCCLQGVFPHADEFGRPFAAGSRRHALAGQPLAPMHWTFACTGFLADWKFLKESFLLPQNYSTVRCCHRCKAQRHDGECSAYDASLQATWRHTLLSTEEFLQMAPATPLTQLPGFHITMLKGDITHTLHLGLCLHVVACSLVELAKANAFSEVPARRSLKIKLHAAWVRFTAWCHERRIDHSQPAFTPARCGVKQGKSPCMISYAAKAHNMRVVTAWLADECRQSPDARTFQGRLRASCTFALAEFQFLLDCSPRFLDTEPVRLAELVKNGYDFLHTYFALHRRAKRLHVKRWPCVPKHHAFMHCIEDMVGLQYSCRFHTCYREEDFVGCIAKIAQACHRKTVGLRTLQRWHMGLQIRLQELQVPP